ncbi:MAG: patatin-like phospholipase family protein [Bacteroidetes bacterium]|nr:patatin-like phospholipase family protein [Bacteroidota bacterium]HET6243065.1 patatin-like phospholipase family protein [Bacteroidia bacterium]
MISRLKYNSRFRRIFFSFPLQLVFLHIKSNLLLLFFWVILLGIISGSIGNKFGLQNLFLNPEYLGEVGFWSFLILGFSCGGFIMAFHIASYILHSFRFPFIATISRPFMKFCLNNSIIPFAFLLLYLLFIITFQYNKEFLPIPEIIFIVSGFLSGIILFLFFSFTYFLSTNKDLFKLFGIGTEEDFFPGKPKFKPVVDVFHKNEKWTRSLFKNSEWYVETYLSNPFKVQLCRDCSHYDREMLNSVFQQNHLNAAFFEIIAIASLLFLGLFREINVFMIPAGATVFLLFTMFIMLTSALYSWLKAWFLPVFLLLIVFVNYLSGQTFFNYENQVYGLDYSTKAVYSNEELKKHAYDLTQNKLDFSNTIEILNKWKTSVVNNDNYKDKTKKPKLVIISCSGGGLRASLWTLFVLQHSDSILKGDLIKHTQFITGSSGGLIGASYFREVYLRSLSDSTINIYDKKYREKISTDLLNPIAFTIVVNDMFLRLQKFKDGPYTYTKERGYAFERQLNINTDNFLDKRLVDYRQPEKDALIPMLVFTPTIINEGRRLIIASQPVSYLTNNNSQSNVYNEPLPEAVEYTRFFKHQDAYNTRFTSALRMNASFPYVLPVTSLPSSPSIEIMDGGIRDNYGLKTTLNYLYTFRNWISTNTSGVVIIQTRDKFKEWEMEKKPLATTIQSLSAPLGNFYGNFDKIQNFNHDELIQYASSWFDGKIDVIDFHLNDKDEKISLSWHLTTKEKWAVQQSIKQPENQRAISKLQELLK